MKIDPQSRVVTLGVRELADFEIGQRTGGRPSGRWRTETGRLWHQTVQDESEEEFSKERPVSGAIERDGWTLRLEGRCDLYRETTDGGLLLGEIKTVTDPLPLPSAELRARFPSYFRQLALYVILTHQRENYAGSFLLFLNIDSGLRQKVACDASDFDALDRHIEQVVAFFQFTAERLKKRETLTWKSFRDHPREGQIEASHSLAEAEQSHRIVGFQAPTGFGKTRIVLEHALDAMHAGKADRILYLTGKTSGQEQVCAEIAHLFPDDQGFRSYRMRNHAEHWAICPVDGCLRDQCAPPSDERSAIPISELTGHPGSADSAWRTVRESAEAFHHCPYALSRSMLPFSDLWIADYNYLFSPSSRHIFWEQPGFEPGRTWLLIDEAHNLEDRVASALGGRLHSRLLFNASEDIRRLVPSGKLAGILRELAREVDSLQAEKPVEGSEFYALTDLLEAAVEAVGSHPLPWRDLPGESLATIQSLDSAVFLLDREELEPLLWSPAQGQLDWLPLKPGPWISDRLGEFAQTVFFSATLEPFSSFTEHFGLAENQSRLVRVDPPGPSRFRVAIDARVKTTLRERGRSASRTAETLQQLSESGTGCVAAFFPSFEYAEMIRAYLDAIAPHLRSIVQPRDLDAQGRALFAETAPLSYDVLFLMLGGSFAEAIDTFGGVVETAMIVGPALPELSTLNRIRMDRYPNREHGFHEVCRIPGMRRVNQAIGRLVRSLDHRATILLHDKRFLEPEFRSLLRPDLGEIEILKTDRDWHLWC